MLEGTPNTTAYLILGLAVSLGAVALYVGSLWLRFRNHLQDEATLDALRHDE